MRSEVDFRDVQGLVRFGYGLMKEASYALVRVKDAAATRAWLRTAPVTTAVTVTPPPSTALHVAFTAAGLAAIGVERSVVAGFSHEFRGGMAEPSRARRLGDVDANAPCQWDWGGNEATAPHLLVMFFAQPGELSAFAQRAMGDHWHEAFTVIRRLGTGDLGPSEPFGFADGISQPAIDWEQERDPADPQIDYTNQVAVGEFLLGYRNEYGKYTDRPLVSPDAASAGLLPADDSPDKKDVARNGTYVVMRQLRQDVRGFWQFIYREAGGDLDAADTLAASIVGRTRGGDPLVPPHDRPIAGISGHAEQIRRNQFTFDGDAHGVRCPLGAHVRRVNPRNADYPGRPDAIGRLVTMLGFGRKGFRDDLISPVRFHRIVRRGREYGPRLSPTEALLPPPVDDPERGLHFICLNANISRQFEFLQNAWITNTKFDALSGGSDPLVGTRFAADGCPLNNDFIIQREDGAARRIKDLPQFVTVRGGAYFFLPGVRALRYFARQGREGHEDS